MVSTRPTLDSDCRQISDIVAALSAAEESSVTSTWNTSDTPQLYRELQHLSKMLAFPGLGMGLGDPPGRAHSHSDVSTTCELNTCHTTDDRNHVSGARFRSDMCLERGHGADTINAISGCNSEMRITENSIQRSSYIFNYSKISFVKYFCPECQEIMWRTSPGTGVFRSK